MTLQQLRYVIAVNKYRNFDGAEVETSVKIPDLAFFCMGVPVKDKVRTATDLPTGKTEKHTLVPDGSITTTLPPYGGKVLKFKL